MREILRFVLFLFMAGGGIYAAAEISGGAVNGAEESRVLRVQLATDGTRPYEENLPGDVLASFSDNVFGTWIRLVAPETYGSDLIDYAFHDGARRISIHVKEGARFHNGRAVTANDFVFSLLRGLYTDNHAFYRGFLGCLDGVGKLAPGEIPRGVSMRSERDVELSFTRSCPEIAHALGLPYVAPRAREELATDLVHFKNLPIGAGAYRVVREDVAAGEYELSRVAEQGSGPARLVLATKVNGTPDISLSRNAALVPDEFTRAYSRTPSMTTTLFASNRHPLLAQPGVRALFYRALDREQIVANAGETPAFSLSSYGSVSAISAADRAEARARLAPLAVTHPTLKIAIFGAPDDVRKQRLIASLTKQFGEIGFLAQFDFVNKKFLTEEDAGEYAYQVANLIIDPLAAGVMLSSWRSNSANPFHQVGDAELETRFRDWEAATDPEAKARAAVRLDDYVTSNGFGVPLLRSRSILIYNPKTVAGLGLQDQPLAIDLSQVSPCASYLSR